MLLQSEKWNIELRKLLCHWCVEEMCLSLFLSFPSNNFLGDWIKTTNIFHYQFWMNYSYLLLSYGKVLCFCHCGKFPSHFFFFSFLVKIIVNKFFPFDSQTMSTLKETNVQTNEFMYYRCRKFRANFQFNFFSIKISVDIHLLKKLCAMMIYFQWSKMCLRFIVFIVFSTSFHLFHSMHIIQIY